MIFPTLWRLVPGPLVVRIVVFVVFIAAIIWCCFVFLFPWIAEALLPTPDAAIDTESG